MALERRTVLVFVGLLLFVLAAVEASPFVGAGSIDVLHAFPAWWNWQFHGARLDPEGSAMVLDLRLLRTVMALLAGGGLALTGAAFQATLRNPLAEPSTLGVSSAAAVGAFVSIAFPALQFSVNIPLPVLHWKLCVLSSTQAGAFVTALAEIALIYGVARLSGQLRISSLLLAGVTLSFMSAGVILLLIHLSADPYKIQYYETWRMGSVDVVEWSKVVPVALLGIPADLVLLWQAHALNPIALGDDFARGRGVSVERVQTLIFVAGSVLTAAVVSTVGPIAFVGLIVPHFVRRLVGSDQRAVLLASLLCGAGFLVACDVAVRFEYMCWNWAGFEQLPFFPVGLVTALLGGPMFLYVLIRTQRGARM